MGLLNKIFPQKSKAASGAHEFFKVFNGYTPIFSNAAESVYEMELTRAAIHAFANFCRKLKPEIYGDAYKTLEKTLQFKPNPFMDTSKFLYRIATILSVNNTAFIIPMESERGHIVGFYPLLPQLCEVIEFGGKPYLRYTFSNGQRAAIEFERVGILTQFQYSDEFFGEDNRALRPTMQLIHAQNQGIVSSIKNSAFVRFLAKLQNVSTQDKDIEAERDKFSALNLSGENHSGLIVYGAKFAELKPIESKPYAINAAQMKQINENVFNYFGVSDKILQNKANEDELNAFYEGKVAPFAIQLSNVLTNMTFTDREIAFDNKIAFTANMLEYASFKTKADIGRVFLDRGGFTINEVRKLLGYPAIEGGDRRYIRKEYADTEFLEKELEIINEKQQGVQGDEPADDNGITG